MSTDAEKTLPASSPSSEKEENVKPSHVEKGDGDHHHNVEDDIHELNIKLSNPLAGLSREELLADVERFAREADLGFFLEDLKKGALVAQRPLNIEEIPELSADDREALMHERKHRWHQTGHMWSLIFLCSMGAAVQGMDETVINGAQLFYPTQFGIGGDSRQDEILIGLVNGAPYLASAVVGCWLTYPLNRWWGRRGAIFVSTFFAFACCIWAGVTNSWPHLFVSRLFLGLGIGPKSATVPVFAAECSPAPIRGALVMQWQVWTAFGIMLGTVSSLIFQHVPDQNGIVGLNWRLMLGSACLPAFFVMIQIWFLVESPRWLLGKKRYLAAYKSLTRLRHHKIQVARDIYYTSKLLEEEAAVEGRRSRIIELFTIPRNARAVLASGVVMFGQQFCGVNAIAYYSSTVFSQSGFSDSSSLLGSFGFGAINWTFALPAFFTIDTFGRRNLLLTTYPGLAACMVLAGCGFIIPLSSNRKARVGLVALGMYLFGCFYSPGMGPVPFSYSAEVFPLYIREIGMAYATAVTWLFNFVIAFTFPLEVGSFGSTGAFMWFAGWNVVLWFLTLLFVPETKQLTLEELDQVFSVPTMKHATYQLYTPLYAFRKYVLRQKVSRAPLYDFENMVGMAEADKGPSRSDVI